MAGLVSSVALFVVGLATLLVAADRFTTAAEKVGLSLGISSFVVGVTIVGIGTSLPELVSSTLAVVQGAPAVVVGNVVGSNVANIFLVLGTAAVVANELRVTRELMHIDLPLMAASAGFLLVAAWDGTFTWLEGLFFLGGQAVYFHYAISEKDVETSELAEEVEVVEEVIERAPVGTRTYAVLVVSLAFVFAGAYGVVESIISIAGLLGVGTEFVAVTAVALGTSLPEVTVSVSAARSGKSELLVGNILGSNIFNTFTVMGVPSLVGTVVVPESIRAFGLPVMLVATILYFFITQDRGITRWEGAILLLLYGTFLVNLFQLV